MTDKAWTIRELGLDSQGLTGTNVNIFAELVDDHSSATAPGWQRWRETWGTGLRRVVPRPELFRTSWPDKPFSGDGFDYSSVFSLTELCALIDSGAASTPSLRMTQGGVAFGDDITSDARLGARPFGSNLDRARVANALDDRGTLAIQGLEGYHSPIRTLCTDVSADLGCMVTATAFYSGGDAPGFPPHYDTHHVLLLQMHGTKVWRLSPPPVADPLPWHTWPERKARTPGLELVTTATPSTVELTPGSHLWIPRGWVHEGLSGASGSLHVTLGITPLDQFWLLQRLADDLGEATTFRQYFPPAWFLSDHEYLRDFQRILTTAVEKIDILATARRINEYVWFASALQPARLLSNQVARQVAEADPSWRLRVNQAAVVAWRTTGDLVELHLGDRVASLPATAAPLLEELRRKNALTVGELSALAGADSSECLRFLLRTGLVEHDL